MLYATWLPVNVHAYSQRERGDMTTEINFTLPECEGWIEQRTDVRGFHLKRFLRLQYGILSHHQKVDGKPTWRLPLQKAVLGGNEFDDYIDIYTPEKSFTFTCPQKEAREFWLQALQKCVRWNISSFYKLGKRLGSGTFANVHEASSIAGGKSVAVKIISKQRLGEFEKKLHESEVTVMRQVRHQHLMTAHDVLEAEDYIYIVMDLMKGDSIVEVLQESGTLSEDHARNLMREILNAVAYLHSKGVVHRDIKPDNVFVESRQFPFGARLGDFGAAGFVEASGLLPPTPHSVGTVGFVAPEYAMAKSCGPKVDIFACGVMLYLLLANFLPFREDSVLKIQRSAVGRAVEFTSKKFANVSEDAKDFIRSLLQVDPRQRPSASETLRHRWMAGYRGSPA